jgi:translation initiation factor IF-3
MAIRQARDAGLDLVEVSPTAEPPVCRIMDYGKYLYEQKRKFKEGKKKSVQHFTTLKEIRLRPETDTHDLMVKMNHAKQFLAKGHRVQFTMIFRGRQMLHQDKGLKVFDQLVAELEEIAKVERPPRMANRRMILIVMPIKS